MPKLDLNAARPNGLRAVPNQLPTLAVYLLQVPWSSQDYCQKLQKNRSGDQTSSYPRSSRSSTAMATTEMTYFGSITTLHGATMAKLTEQL